MCYSNDPGMEEENEDEEPTLNQNELDLLEEMENRRIQYLSDLQESFNDILEAQHKFLGKPAENVTKVKWGVVIKFSKELHQAALIWIELKLFEPPMIEHTPKFFSLLSKLLKLANGAIVGTERSLRKCIRKSVKAVLQDGLNLIAGAATPSESDDERRGKTVKLVASFLDALADLKKVPTNNLAALELQLMKVTGELYDVLTEWKKPKKASSDPAAPSCSCRLSKMETVNVVVALADMTETVNVKKGTRLVLEYLSQMLWTIHHFLMKKDEMKDEEGLIIVCEEVLHLFQSVTKRAKKALAHMQDGDALYALFDESHNAMLQVVLYLDALDISDDV